MTGHRIFSEVNSVLYQLMNTLIQLNDNEFSMPLDILGKSSIGEHTRHIIELFEKPIKDYELGLIDYDNRERNVRIQTEINFAVECINKILSEIEKPNKSIDIVYKPESTTAENDNYTEVNDEVIQSNYFREILYNLEHCIHHQALIKIGLKTLGKNIVDENFGVAKSTINYRAQCAQ
jgi:hypothetical protein